MANPETKIQNDILVALSTFPGMIVWRSAVGNGWVRTGNGFRPMRFGGIPGQADIIGCWRGRFIAIEVKTKDRRSKKSAEQEAWGNAIIAAGGLYIVARSVDEALDGLHRPQVSDMVIDVGRGGPSPAAPTAAVARVLHPLDATAATPLKADTDK